MEPGANQESREKSAGEAKPTDVWQELQRPILQLDRSKNVTLDKTHMTSVGTATASWGIAVAGELLALERLAELNGPTPAPNNLLGQTLDLWNFVKFGGLALLASIDASTDMMTRALLSPAEVQKSIVFGLHMLTGEDDGSKLERRYLELNQLYNHINDRLKLRENAKKQINQDKAT